MNERYVDTLVETDVRMAPLVEAIERRAEEFGEEWLVIITSDHGGHRNPDGTGSHNHVWLQDEVCPSRFLSVYLPISYDSSCSMMLGRSH